MKHDEKKPREGMKKKMHVGGDGGDASTVSFQHLSAHRLCAPWLQSRVEPDLGSASSVGATYYGLLCRCCTRDDECVAGLLLVTVRIGLHTVNRIGRS